MARYVGPRPQYSGRVAHEIITVKTKSDTPLQVQEAFASAMETLFPSLPGRISDLRDALGGTNKAAQAIGVTPRSIQRYIAAEEGRHSQTRRADIAKRGDIVRALQGALAPQLRGAREAAILREGVAMTALGTLRIGDYSSGRFVHWRLDGPAWKPILKAYNAGKTQTAARAFNKAFGQSYGGTGARWNYLYELTFEPPA